MRLFLACLLALASGPLAAQVAVSGTVSDSTGTALPGATALLLSPADSVMVSFASSRADGAFEIRRVREGAYILKVSFVGYRSHEQNIEVASDDLDVGTVTLQSATDELGRLVVAAERVPLVLRGDTLDYDAAAFGTPQGATVEDLLRRLPGVEVDSDGSITAQGEQVDNVLVDGKEFFGDDPTIATQNLPADAVDRVQVYDQASDTAEFTGVDDGEEERTINLELKEDRRSGVFGNVSGGFGGVPGGASASGVGVGGPGALYDGRASVNRFSPSTQVSLIANVNNVNRQSFSVSDYFQFLGGPAAMASGGTFTFRTNGAIPIGDGPGDGFSETASGGLNLNHEFSDRTSLQSSYFLHTLDKTRDETLSREQFFGQDLTSRLEQQGRDDQTTQLHRLSLNGAHEFADDHDVRLRSSLRLGLNGSDAVSQRQTFGIAGLQENGADTDYDSDGTTLGGDATLTYRRKFSGNRSLIAEATGDLNSSDADADFLATNRLFQNGDLLTQEEIAQLQSERGDTFTAGASLTFTQPLAQKQALQFRLEHRETHEDQTREVFDLIGGDQVLNALQSSAFERVYRFDRGGAQFISNAEPLSVSGGAVLQLTRLGGTQFGLTDALDRQFLRVLPEATLGYAISDSRSINLRYSTSTREPSVRELQPVVDNRDPLRIYVGNPGLLPAYTHSVSLRYLSFDQFTSTNLFASLRASYSPTAISTARFVDAQLRQNTTPINTTGTWTINGNGSFGTVVRPLASRVSVSTNGVYNRAIELVNAEENVSSLLRATVNLRIENRTKDRFDLVGGARVTYNNVAYSLNPQLDRDYVNRGFFAELGWSPSEAWEFRTEIDVNVFGDAVAGASAGARSVPLWRAEAARTILDGRARVELEATDLLDRNLGIDFTNAASFVQESRVNTLGRYVLMRFVYNLGASGGRPGGGGIRIVR
ncbi:MAG: outer membrane beta-barrel protein [Bacteroidota bacterium]